MGFSEKIVKIVYKVHQKFVKPAIHGHLRDWGDIKKPQKVIKQEKKRYKPFSRANLYTLFI